MSNWSLRGSVWLLFALPAAPIAAQQTVQLPARDVALRQQPTTVYSVGTVEGRDWEMFSQVRAVAFDESDNMYLLDGQNLRVIVFDADGRYVRQWGKRGGGPGEFQAPMALDLTSDGNVVVSDLANRAFIVFRPTGEYVRNVPFNDRLGFPLGFTTDFNRGVMARATARIRPDQPAATEGNNFSTVFRHSLDEGGSTAPHALYQIPVTPPRVIEGGSGPGTRRVMSISMDPVFSARPSFSALPNGLAVHHGAAWEVRIIDDNGRHVRSLTRPFEPRRVTKRDQDAWRERRRENERNGTGTATVVMSTTAPGGSSVTVGGGRSPGGAAPPSIAFNMDDVEFAEVMSVVTRMETDPHGRIWVQRRNEDGTDDGPIDIVTAAGRYIGTVGPLPMPRAISASGLAAWVETDDLGVEKVVVKRLPAEWLRS